MRSWTKLSLKIVSFHWLVHRQDLMHKMDALTCRSGPQKLVLVRDAGRQYHRFGSDIVLDEIIPDFKWTRSKHDCVKRSIADAKDDRQSRNE